MPKPDINVTPLIDVLLVLLIIFMVISPLKPARFEAKIPQPPDPATTAGEDADLLEVVVNPDGSFTLNGETEYGSFAELPRLAADIGRILENAPEDLPPYRQIFIKAPKSMEYGRVVRLIDAVMISGKLSLALQIDDLGI